MHAITSVKNLTITAILFHLVGLIGIGVFHAQIIAQTAPWHLLLMFTLLLLSFAADFRYFFAWLLIAMITGFGAEWIGVHKGWLFGIYHYTAVLGPSWQQVPIIIACNWAVVICGAISLASLATMNKYLMPLTAATIATCYDWILEPAAIKLDYWHWQGPIQWINYGSWWIIALMLSILWQYFKVRPNQFAINLFIVQVLFFALIRTII